MIRSFMICTPGIVVLRGELSREWGRLHNEELHYLQSSYCGVSLGDKWGIEKPA